MEPQQNQVELHDRRLEFEHEQLHNYDEKQEEMRRLWFVCLFSRFLDILMVRFLGVLHILYCFALLLLLHVLMLSRLTWTFVHCYRLLSRDDSILPLRDIFYDCIQALRRR